MTALLTAMLLIQPSPQTPDQEVLARLPGEIAVTRIDYLEYLYKVFGHVRLEELLLDRALEREVGTLDLDGIAPAVQAGLRDPQARSRQALKTLVDANHDGDFAAYDRYLARTGRTRKGALRSLQTETLRRDRIAAIIQVHRQSSEPRLRRLFDEHYGVDGLQVRVRHIYQSFDKVHRELTAHADPGEKISEKLVDATVRQRMQTLLLTLQDGSSFATAVAQGSDDLQARQQAKDPRTAKDPGWIRNYRFQRFGVEFAQTVRSMKSGELRGPVKAAHGYHIIKLETLKQTRFEDVQDELNKLLKIEPASLAEQRQLRERLLKKYQITEALRK